MVKFPSDEWLQAFVDQLNNSKNFTSAAKKWEGDFLMVITAEGPLKETVYMYLDMTHGVASKAARLSGPPAKKAAFVMSSPLGVFRRVLEKKLHPTAAIARRLIKVEGNFVLLLANNRVGQAILEALNNIPTEFPE